MDIEVAKQDLGRMAEMMDGLHVESTSAVKVNYAGVLYNVDGSRDDPHIGGFNWKPLLIDRGINSNCYVTSPAGEKSHPDFSVGGHMTVNQDGSVPVGGTCYLMPLCYWHNSKSKDGIAFSHTKTLMLQLSGYMQAELMETFLARMPSDQPFSIVYPGEDGFETQKLSEAQMRDKTSLLLEKRGEAGLPEHYLLFRQVEHEGRTMHMLEDAAV